MKVCCSINSHQVFAPKPEILFSALVSFRRAVNLIKVGFFTEALKRLLGLQCNKQRNLIQFSLIITLQKCLHSLNSEHWFDGLQVTAKADRQFIRKCLQSKVYGLMATVQCSLLKLVCIQRAVVWWSPDGLCWIVLCTLRCTEYEKCQLCRRVTLVLVLVSAELYYVPWDV